MTTFGTSAYMKLLGLNPKPRDTELRDRILPTGGGGYDFHKAMRRIASEFASDEADWTTTKARLRAIKKRPERESATAAAFAFKRWGNGRSIRLLADSEQRVSSPNEVFSIKFSPDFEIELDGVPTRIHIWNTKKPHIRIREAIGTLGHFVTEDSPSSIGVLSLRTGELFLPTDYSSSRELARILAIDIEKRFLRISGEHAGTVLRAPPPEKRAG